MKKLDEVIKAIEVCQDSYVAGKIIKADALHYLKEYRDKAHRLDIGIAEHARSFEQLGVEIARYQEAVKNCEEAENKYRQLAQNLGEVGNPPLTWDELKTMEGKPVWVEYESCNRKVWAIIDCFYTDAFLKDKINVALPHDYWNLQKEMMGKTWKAYRKERIDEKRTSRMD